MTLAIKPSNPIKAIVGISFSLLASSIFANIQSPVVWAVNLGGEAYRADNTLQYQADNCSEQVSCSSVPAVEGTQVQPLYKSYRTGNLLFSHPLNNGV